MKKSIVFLFLMATAMQLSARGDFVAYKADGKEYQGYYIGASSGKGLVILVHDWDGLDEYEIKRAEMLNKEGYAVFAVDLFGKGVKAETTEQRQALTGALYADREKMRLLLHAGVREAEKQFGASGRTVAAGYCFGGAAVLELARSGTPLKAFVTFHGGLDTPEGQDYSRTKSKVVVFHGTADSSVTMTDFADLARELEKKGVPHEMITYSGAPHAFTVFGSPRYREKADRESWARFLEVLKEVY
ncbi:MAG: dienelactone hydrolase family protein [Spirochaetales bacterium]|nr:dienelactone hydrolase family protein [Spirochaetales bacterium]